ncbi:MAG: hypothetical protein IPP48_16560 [Chitinophagaceae bacterium]|nr:hypothetical protein [Chitinophagaceae bacterium]
MAKKIVLFAIIPFVLLSILDFTTSIKGTFSFVPLVVECLVILTYILYFFYEKMRSDIFTPAYQTRAFWIAVAFTLFCSGNFFLFLYSNNSVKDDLYKLQYTIIYSTFTILKNLFICIGLSIKEPTTVGSNIQHGKVDDIWEIPIDYKKTNL